MTIKITYGTVTAAAADIRSAAKDLTNELNALEDRVMKVVNTWNGEARNAFKAKHDGWGRDVSGLNTTLNAIADKLDESTSGYQQTDRRAAQRFEF
ncbi:MULTISPECIES: WXG100 family type VII secretion target [Streptomyces]|uniref:ESAT-6-like protein n=1 Tax=Streptomyces radiopugnans TaxID=403935 RepID=A0A1H9IM08_9ACTN|nr:WXG100 family type VII secretion target [Streptomyces radiopugnans]URN13370.1 WXG100 family type VII secretion target [Streptomyces radiopugnans]SEQ75761.1 WXG100 family type VII secretion target [Streptomyces radiopugnans]